MPAHPYIHTHTPIHTHTHTINTQNDTHHWNLDEPKCHFVCNHRSPTTMTSWPALTWMSERDWHSSCISSRNGAISFEVWLPCRNTYDETRQSGKVDRLLAMLPVDVRWHDVLQQARGTGNECSWCMQTMSRHVHAMWQDKHCTYIQVVQHPIIVWVG